MNIEYKNFFYFFLLSNLIKLNMKEKKIRKTKTNKQTKKLIKINFFNYL